MFPVLASHHMLPDSEAVLAVLRTCRDPEIPLNLVDLGLIYGVAVKPIAESPDQGEVNIRLTLTSPGCPMSHAIAAEVQRKVGELAGVRSVKIETVWEPAWHPAMISAEGKRQLELVS